MLTDPIKGEALVMYLAASIESISAVLLAERGRKQTPVYIMSRTLQGAELDYLELEKLILALILADFLAKIPSAEREEMEAKETTDKVPENMWKLYTDGASSSDGSGAGLMLVNLEGKEYTYALRLLVGGQPSQRTLRSKTASDKAIPGENKGSPQRLPHLFHGACSARSEQKRRFSKQTRASTSQEHNPKDTSRLLRNAYRIKIHSSIPRKPKQDITSITSAWPFSQWGTDIMGPLAVAPRGARFLIVAIDYFTKYVEAKPLLSTTEKHMEKFIWEHIFGEAPPFWTVESLRLGDNQAQGSASRS
ncbi:reverse transcriptase domain-containing protein [Tanacetum coccineum]